MIRETVESDKDGVIDLIQEFYLEELHKFEYRFDRAQAEADFLAAIKVPVVYSLVIDNGQIDGFIGAIISKRMFLAGVTAMELMWYVKPSKRREGIRLLQAFERGCKDRGCDDVMMIGLEGSKACKAYELLGYRKQESMYFKKIGG